MTLPVQDALEVLKASAGQNMSVHTGKPRIAVQVSHCSSSVGAVQVFEALVTHAPSHTYVVTAGCDGACYDAPRVVITTPDGTRRVLGGVRVEDVEHIVKSRVARVEGVSDTRKGSSDLFAGQHRLALDACGEIDSSSLDEYLLTDGYIGLAKALSTPPGEVIDEVKASGLLGRGGAYFPTAMKWESARRFPSPDRYLVVNCEEGEPGIFKDRHLMEGVPHRILEGALIAAYAAGVQSVYIYINAEAELSTIRKQQWDRPPPSRIK